MEEGLTEKSQDEHLSELNAWIALSEYIIAKTNTRLRYSQLLNNGLLITALVLSSFILFCTVSVLVDQVEWARWVLVSVSVLLVIVVSLTIFNSSFYISINQLVTDDSIYSRRRVHEELLDHKRTMCAPIFGSSDSRPPNRLELERKVVELYELVHNQSSLAYSNFKYEYIEQFKGDKKNWLKRVYGISNLADDPGQEILIHIEQEEEANPPPESAKPPPPESTKPPPPESNDATPVKNKPSDLINKALEDL